MNDFEKCFKTNFVKYFEIHFFKNKTGFISNNIFEHIFEIQNFRIYFQNIFKNVCFLFISENELKNIF